MDQDKEVKVDQYREEAMYEYADKFINLANELSKLDNSGSVGVGLRFAASRYSAFEASLQTNNLTKDKDKYLKVFENAFKNMLKINIEEYGKLQKLPK